TKSRHSQVSTARTADRQIDARRRPSVFARRLDRGDLARRIRRTFFALSSTLTGTNRSSKLGSSGGAIAPPYPKGEQCGSEHARSDAGNLRRAVPTLHTCP